MTDTPMPPNTPAGWHEANGQMCYWDGNQWTEHTAPANAGRPKKKRRIFWWFFLAVQILFLIWIIAGAHSGADHSSCVGQTNKYFTEQDCENAQNAGTGIGVVLIIVFWCVVDVILGVIYGVYRLAKRS